MALIEDTCVDSYFLCLLLATNKVLYIKITLNTAKNRNAIT